MIYPEKPPNFSPKFEVVSCFVEYDKKILLLHRQDHKSEGNTWGVPAGKVNAGEKILEAMVRELREETGFNIPPNQIVYFNKVYVKYPEFDFVYYIFSTNLDKPQTVTINPQEHKGFKWISPEKALDTLLTKDLDACIRLFYDN